MSKDKQTKPFLNRSKAVLAGVAALLASGLSSAAVVIDTSGIKEQIEQGATSAGAIGGYIVIALSVIVTIGIIIACMRKT